MPTRKYLEASNTGITVRLSRTIRIYTNLKSRHIRTTQQSHILPAYALPMLAFAPPHLSLPTPPNLIPHSHTIPPRSPFLTLHIPPTTSSFPVSPYLPVPFFPLHLPTTPPLPRYSEGKTRGRGHMERVEYGMRRHGLGQGDSRSGRLCAIKV